MIEETPRCMFCSRRFHCRGCLMFHRPYNAKHCKTGQEMEAGGMFQDAHGRWKRLPAETGGEKVTLQ